MTQLSADERRVITLAYLEGRTNREIAAILGVSVSTVRRRLWVALAQLDAYISRTRTWLSAIVLLGAGSLIARAHRLERAANADWTHKLASTVAIGAVTAAAIGLTAVIPDSTGSPRSSTPATGRLIAAAPSMAVPEAPSMLSNLESPQKSSTHTAGQSTTDALTIRIIPPVSAGGTPPSTVSHHANHGCGGNPTSAAPPVPVGTHAYRSPVTHPSAGGCQV